MGTKLCLCGQVARLCGVQDENICRLSRVRVLVLK